MPYEHEKHLFRELLVSERTLTVDGQQIIDLCKKLFNSKELKKYNFRIILNMEEGKKKGLWHTHTIIHWKDIMSVPPPTTFRSQIQKYLGKSNTLVDWKYRKVRKTLDHFLKYCTKDGNSPYNINFPKEVYDRYKGTYRFDDTISKWLARVGPFVKRCETCIEWEHKICKRDAVKAVLDYWDSIDKKYNKFYLEQDARTLLCRTDDNARDNLIDEVVDRL